MSFEGIQLIYSAEVCREAIPLARSIECEGSSTYVRYGIVARFKRHSILIFDDYGSLKRCRGNTLNTFEHNEQNFERYPLMNI